MNTTYEISVFFFNGEVPMTRDKHMLYSKKFALERAEEFGKCDNVTRVEVINSLTGELILVIEDQRVTWRAEE